MYKHILIPTDGSHLSERAIEHGVALARSINARVTGITVFPYFHTFAPEPMLATDTREQYREDCARQGTKYLEVVEHTAKAADVPCEVMQVMHDDPYRAIIEAASEKGCDLIVMASHGRKGAAGLLLGSETTKVLTHSRIPVLVCR